jgi:hypothetical protein
VRESETEPIEQDGLSPAGRMIPPDRSTAKRQANPANRSRDRLRQPRLSPSFWSRGLQALAKFVQTSPSLQTPATSPVSPLKWTQDESTSPHAMSPTATSENASIFIAI